MIEGWSPEGPTMLACEISPVEFPNLQACSKLAQTFKLPHKMLRTRQKWQLFYNGGSSNLDLDLQIMFIKTQMRGIFKSCVWTLSTSHRMIALVNLTLATQKYPRFPLFLTLPQCKVPCGLIHDALERGVLHTIYANHSFVLTLVLYLHGSW